MTSRLYETFQTVREFLEKSYAPDKVMPSPIVFARLSASLVWIHAIYSTFNQVDTEAATVKLAIKALLEVGS